MYRLALVAFLLALAGLIAGAGAGYHVGRISECIDHKVYIAAIVGGENVCK